MENIFKKGDYVNCSYEGKTYKGCLMENPKNEIVKIKILVSPKRSEPPIFEEVMVSIHCLESLRK